MPSDDDDRRDDDDDEPVDEDDTGPPVTLEALKLFVATRPVLGKARTLIAARVPEKDADDLVNDAIERALRARKRPSEPRMQPWFDRICARTAAGHLRKRARRKKYEGAMPVAPVKLDEAGLPVADPYAGDVADIDPSYDPEQEDFRAEGILLRRFLRQAVAGNARDEQTLSWMIQWADEDKTYAQIADENGVTLTEIGSRVHAFKKKYLERYRRYRNAVILLLVLAGAAIVVLAWWLWPGRRPAPAIGPDTWPLAPSSAPSASAGPPARTFDQALPPSPSASVPAPESTQKPGTP